MATVGNSSAPVTKSSVTTFEHHSNIVPWQMLAEAKGARIRVAPINDAGELLMDDYQKLFNTHTKLVGCNARLERARHDQPDQTHGRAAHAHGVPVLVDGAQAVPHRKVDVQDLVATSTPSRATSFAARPASAYFTARPCFPKRMQPFKGGGDMILSVTFEKTSTIRYPTNSRPARRRSRRRSGSAPRSTTCRRSAWTPSPPTNSNCSTTQPNR